MDRSVYTPGAGHMPMVLAGRDELLHSLRVRLSETASAGRRRSRDTIFTGVRGVGKTALLTVYADLAVQQGFQVVGHQAVRGRPGLVEAILAEAQERLAQEAGPWTRARRALERVGSVSMGVAGASVSVDRADSSPAAPVHAEILAAALAALAEEIRSDVPTGGLALTLDEVQVAGAADLTLLAAALHQLNVRFPSAPVAFAGSGLPTVPSDLRAAGVTHPDRLFTIEGIPPTLSRDEALYAVIEPARRVGVWWESAAADLVVAAADRYPAHVQLFADEAWLAATGPGVITERDADVGRVRAEQRIARQSLGPRVNELSGRKLEYLTAVAVNGGTVSAGALAATLDRRLAELSWLRDELIRDGDIYSPNRGHVALAVPVFSRYLVSTYGEARELSDTSLLTLAQMKENRANYTSRTATPSRAPVLRDPHAVLVANTDPEVGTDYVAGEAETAELSLIPWTDLCDDLVWC